MKALLQFTRFISSLRNISGLNFSPMKAITALLVFTLVLSGCSGSSFNPVTPPSVHAAPPPPPYAGGCANATGQFGTAKEAPGSYIALVDTACSLIVPQPIETDTQTLDACGKDQVVNILVTADIHVHAIRLWIGAGVTSRFETGVCAEIITAGVVTKQFRREWDKHVEEHFSDQPFVVDFVIPAGSTVRLSREPHATIECPASSAACATQEMLEMWGE